MNVNIMTGPYITGNKETAKVELIENHVLPGTHTYIHIWTSSKNICQCTVLNRVKGNRRELSSCLWWMFTKLHILCLPQQWRETKLGNSM